MPFSFAGLPAAFSLIPAVCVAVAWYAPVFRGAGFIIALIMADYLRGHILTGFPWNMPVHMWAETPAVMALLSHIGFYALNALTIFFISALFVTRRPLVTLGIVLLCAALLVYPGGGKDAKKPSVPDNIVMVQANISQKDKWNPDHIRRNMGRYMEMTDKAIKDDSPKIVIWPETAISQNFLSYPEPRQAFSIFLNSLPRGSMLVTGYLNSDKDGYYNSLAVFDRAGELVTKYDKHHLVPFGEYMPLGIGTITGFEGFLSGDVPPLVSVGDVSFLPLICYEIIFPRYAKAADSRSFILNITNDAWFGHTAGPYQHFDHARFRAAENGVPVIRLSGNGISGVISPTGEIVMKTSLNKKAVIVP